ncbi:hypothetical protein NQ315_004027 [Exocentrus adspersus]|uniref:Ig-like domain-containing protein n=1 Tax=Exocentrus adspersus TaxID=1586481 RepID=A0AAV8W6W8_9CUCU|nr:hypothetical protein NQ315_004027 [Exocentrus adspersus]
MGSLFWMSVAGDEGRRATEYTVLDASGEYATGRSVLQLTLTRGDLLARFECKVESEALEDPIISWVTIDVHVTPTRIDLSGVKNHVVQGTNVLLICDVHGARPAASIRWANGTFPIIDENLVQTSPEDNVSAVRHISELVSLG